MTSIRRCVKLCRAFVSTKAPHHHVEGQLVFPARRNRRVALPGGCTRHRRRCRSACRPGSSRATRAAPHRRQRPGASSGRHKSGQCSRPSPDVPCASYGAWNNPCLRTFHLPSQNTFRPVLSTRCSGSLPQGRQHDVEIPRTAIQRRVVGHRQIGEYDLVHQNPMFR
jgi:hypothetical protein